MIKKIFFLGLLSIFVAQAMDEVRNETDWNGSCEQAICCCASVAGAGGALFYGNYQYDFAHFSSRMARFLYGDAQVVLTLCGFCACRQLQVADHSCIWGRIRRFWATRQGASALAAQHMDNNDKKKD